MPELRGLEVRVKCPPEIGRFLVADQMIAGERTAKMSAGMSGCRSESRG